MNDLFASVFLGLFFLVAFYCVSLFLIIGIKSGFQQIKLIFFKLKEKTPSQKNSTPRKRYKKPKTSLPAIRSIEINADDVDRIYVRKSS